MGEKIIDLGGHNPLDIYGTNNKTLTFILDFFQKSNVLLEEIPLNLLEMMNRLENLRKNLA